MSNYRLKTREYQQEYYGGYCSKCKEKNITPLDYTIFKEILSEAVTLYESKKGIMKFLIENTN